ncbi:hypothetical protein DHB64_04940 [Antarcticibacterium sp. W02-3]|nr:hypothetical protein [Antarcticibacterium sp. W02-3]
MKESRAKSQEIRAKNQEVREKSLVPAQKTENREQKFLSIVYAFIPFSGLQKTQQSGFLKGFGMSVQL